jgi:hypothetical protein
MFAVLSEKKVPFWAFLVVAFVLTLLVFAWSRVNPVSSLLLRSEITGYFPAGQMQYGKSLARELKKSKTLTVIGARGLDLIGPRSELGAALGSWTGEVTAYLIDPASTHVRLRSGALEVERDQYHSELNTVVASLRLVGIQAHSTCRLHTYDKTPYLRAIIFDKVAYVATYNNNVQGRKLPTYRVKLRTGQIAELIRSYIDSLNGVEIPPVSISDLSLGKPGPTPQEQN